MSIVVENVSKYYGSQKALDSVSFSVEPGSVTGFLGPNGAGKSTMMKIITCFIPAKSGKVEVCGLNVSADSLEIRKIIGYLPEHNPLYTEMYVKEFLQFKAGLYKLNKPVQRIKDMIEMTGLEKEQHKKIGALSKGYRQRVGLAQALLHDPEVLVLDEPTTGLDPNQLVEIRELIKTLGKTKTVLFSSHIMQEVQAVSNRVLIIHQGRMVADRETGQLYTAGDSIKIIIEFNRPLNADIRIVAGVRQAEKINETTWKITTGADTEVRQELFKWAVQQDRTILTLKTEENSLEDLFRSLTG